MSSRRRNLRRVPRAIYHVRAYVYVYRGGTQCAAYGAYTHVTYGCVFYDYPFYRHTAKLGSLVVLGAECRASSRRTNGLLQVSSGLTPQIALHLPGSMRRHSYRWCMVFAEYLQTNSVEEVFMCTFEAVARNPSSPCRTDFIAVIQVQYNY